MARRAATKRWWTRWRATVAYIILAAGLLGALARVEMVSNQNDLLLVQVARTCVDARASHALRVQWARVLDIIHRSQQLKPGQPGYMTQQEASRAFIESYRLALREAGPEPDCQIELLEGKETRG